MDLSQYSTADLQAMRAGNWQGMSTGGLQTLRGQQANSAPPETDTSPSPDDSWTSKMGRAASLVANRVGKLGGIPNALTTGPFLGSAMESATKPQEDAKGKIAPDPHAPAYTGQDVLNALNPLTDKTFPTDKEMAARRGIPNPSLSDAIPSAYSPSGTQSKAYSKGGPVTTGALGAKGGLLDPSLWGAAQLADPAMAMGGGELGAAERALNETSTLGKLRNAVADMPPVNPISAPSNLLKAVPAVGQKADQIAGTLFNPVGSAVSKLGKAVYGATVRPVEHAGNVFGKEDVVDRLQQAGVLSPIGMQEKLKNAANTLGAKANTMMDQSAAKGGTVDMDAALAPGYQEVARLRGLGSDSANDIATNLENELNSAKQKANGTPGTPDIPASTRDTTHSFTDSTGDETPYSTTTEEIPGIPGTPAVPPQPFTPKAARNLKSFYSGQVGNGAYKPALATPVGSRGLKAAAGGLAQETENTLDRTLGPGSGAALNDINDAQGIFLGTRPGQRQAENMADRQVDNLVKPTGIDAAVGGGVLGVTGDPLKALLAVAAKKAGQGAGLVTMPTGRAIQALGDTNALDRLMQLINAKGTQNGQKTNGR